LKIIIFANGTLSFLEKIQLLIQSCDLIIAADGGARHCLAARIIPNVVIGDFDSLLPSELETLQAQGAQLIRYPTRKDFTDLELALEYARQQNPQQVIILGGLGQRWDQTLANLLLLANPANQNFRISLIDGSQEIMLIHASQTFEIHGKPGDTVSLIPIQGNADGITTRGLEYPLTNESLQFGTARGVSNALMESTGTIYLHQGMLICVIIRQEYFQ
jgi:thiamine pyrophosphokinase